MALVGLASAGAAYGQEESPYCDWGDGEAPCVFHLETEAQQLLREEIIGESWLAPGVPPPRIVFNEKVPPQWSLSDESLWEQIKVHGGYAVVAIKDPELNRGFFKGTVLVSSETFNEAVDSLLTTEGVTKAEVRFELPQVGDGQDYPAIAVKLDTFQAFVELRGSPFADFIEGLYFTDINLGCGLPEYTQSGGDTEYRTNLVPWTFRHFDLERAWRMFPVSGSDDFSPGAGVKVGVLDTGVFSEQQQLWGRFSVGQNRTAVHGSVTPDPYDHCGHGTRIAGLIAAPADYPTDSNIVGIAWGSSLVTVKVNDSVLQFEPSASDIVDGINVAIKHGALVINMAMGMPHESTLVREYIEFFSKENPKLIFVAAAGTGVPYVVFPASMREVVAASAVSARDPYNPSAGYEQIPFLPFPGPGVAYGNSVDFVSMDHLTGWFDVFGVWFAQDTKGVPTTGRDTSKISHIGGSSAGTAHISGIIALARARYPNLNRGDLLRHVSFASSHSAISGSKTDGRHPRVGYGIPNAYLATGAATKAFILGPEKVTAGRSYTLSARSNGMVPHEIMWDDGQTSPTATFVAPSTPGSTRRHLVSLRNPIDGSVLTAAHDVFSGLAAAHERILFSQTFARWPNGPTGADYELLVNEGRQVPLGCTVGPVTAQEVDGDGKDIGTPKTQDSNTWRSWKVTRDPNFMSNRHLQSNLELSHSAFSAVRVKLRYWILETDGVDCKVPGLFD